MRNGMNISGFSEIVHEIQEEPAQAIFRYAAYARAAPDAGVLAGVHPALIGLLKAPRHFEVPISPEPALKSYGLLDVASPQELALTALLGCFLVSAVSGFSARRTTVDHLSMTTSAALFQARVGAPQVRYQIRSDTDKKIGEALDVIEAVKTHSPNHQTFVQSLGLSARLAGPCGARPWVRFPGISASAGDTPVPSQALSLDCQWLYGTQLRSNFLRQNPEDPRTFPIDQPKQLAGIDWGPNPQEYLLMAIAADVLLQLRARHPLASEVQLNVRAMVDIRGMCEVAPSPVHLQDIELHLQVGECTTEQMEQLEQQLAQSIECSTVCALIRKRVDFEFDVGAQPVAP
jgi:uncharacterized OsmC-like protein